MGINMKPTRQLHDLGQSLWLDNITRTLLDDGTLARYIAEDSITGLTSNPSIFDVAIGGGDAYDAAIHGKTLAGLAGEALFTELALEDLRRAADLFRPAFDATDQVDGWVSMEISPLLAADTAGSVAAARRIHEQARRANLFVKIPGTAQGLAAIEEAIFLGIPINVTLLFSCAHYKATAQAYLRGIERRLEAGLDPRVALPATRSCPPSCTTSSASRSRGRPTAPTASCWPRRAGRNSPLPVPGRNACCGPAPAPRTRLPPTRCTSARLPHRTPSTPFPRRPCMHSPTTAACGA
jgi:hypothetical protein